MHKVVVVGSGASGIHFALTLLEKGYEVVMVDVGNEPSEGRDPAVSFSDLKESLQDPVGYFLGHKFEGIIHKGPETEFYGFPPNKQYVFSSPQEFQFRSSGFAPLTSFAAGGMAEVWTGGVYPFNDEELRDFPFSYRDIEPYYSKVAERIGLTGTNDDLTRFFPIHDNLSAPLDLDYNSRLLLKEYERQKDYLNKKLKCYFGRSRAAVLSENQNGREKCTNLGRCLWGCPSQSFYTPAITLAQCKAHPNFKYFAGLYVSHFEFNSKRQITHVIATSPKDRNSHRLRAETLVLAAGTLSSSKIFMDSIFRATGEIITLEGLMDNRQILVPFLNLKMIGQSYDTDSYQYHQMCLGLESEDPKEYVHGQITTLKTALVHPLIQNIPLDLRTAIFLFRSIRAGLGVVNVNLHDTRRADCYLTLQSTHGAQRTKLVVHYCPSESEEELMTVVIKKVKKALRGIGCFVLPGLHIRPKGASVHYAGTLPMSTTAPYKTSQYCQSEQFPNLYIVDGTTFPFLPAKNITFTLMANAVRVAENGF